MTGMDDKAAHTMSAAEQTLRSKIETIIGRVSSGATVHAALRAAGYSRTTTKRIVAIGNGGHPDVTDEGLRAACEQLAQASEAAAAEIDAALAERWKFLATVGDDWRSIAELLKRRNPDEWLVTEKTEIELGGGVDLRSEDAVLAALGRLQAESGGSRDVEPVGTEPILPNPEAP